MCNILIVSQVCAVERKEHAAHIGAGSKEAKGSDAESRKSKEGWYDAQATSAPVLSTVNDIWFVLVVLWVLFGLK